MEIKFNKKPLDCMLPALTQVQSIENAQELRLPDGYPDIGRILGCWGQPVIRGKEWRRTSVGANGGVMVWVMYAPEDGTEPRVIDAWIPFQTRWELPENVEDGIITVVPCLSDLDARNVSARKIIVRACLDLMAEAKEYTTKETYTSNEVPDDVQVLVKNYPVDLPMEAGEKQVRIEEDIVFPSDKPAVQRIISYELIPSVQEQKVLANRLVFRGTCLFRLRYLSEDGNVNMWSTELPFSEYTDLKNDYDTSATAWIVPVVTALEVDAGDQITIRAGIAAQYTIFDRKMLELTEDAYSPYRDVTLQTQALELPVLLDKKELQIPVNALLRVDADQVLDLSQQRRYPYLSIGEDGMSIRQQGQHQMLYRNQEGMLLSDDVRYEEAMPFASADDNHVQLWPGIVSDCEYTHNGSEVTVKGQYPVTAFTYASCALPMVTGMEYSEQKELDPDRPSLILRRAGEEDLWAMAKRYGSTVDAIRKANKLTQDPLEGEMLLVPVC